MIKHTYGRARTLSRCVFTWATIAGIGMSPIANASEPLPVPPAEELQPTPAARSSVSPWHTQIAADGKLRLRLFTVPTDRMSYEPATATPSALMRGANVVTAGRTDDTGIATFSRLHEGPHTFMAVGRSGFCSVGLLLTKTKPADADLPVITPEVALVPVSDSVVIRELLSKQSRTTVTPIGNLISNDELEDAISHRIPQFVIDSDGTIQGRFIRVERAGVRAIPDLNIALVRNQAVIAKTTSDNDGIFRFSSQTIQPGLVSVAAYGSQGYAIFGAEIVESAATADHQSPLDGTIQVAFQVALPTAPVTINLADPESFNAFFQSIAPSPGINAGGAPGGAGTAAANGGGTGGGGGGAGGGAGGLLGIAGLTAGLTAIGIEASKDDSPPPASPAAP